jgi:hypothetical protein
LTTLSGGGLLLCSTQTITAQSSNATSYNWSTTGGLSVSASGNQASLSGTSDGTVQVSAYSSTCNYTSPTTSQAIVASAPSASSITITNDYGQPLPGTMCNGTGLVIKATNPTATSYSWALSGNSQNVYFTDYGGGRAYFNSYVNSCYGVSAIASNCRGSGQSGITICVINCGYRMYNVSPNPAKDELNVTFEDSKEGKNFPELLELLPEKAGAIATLKIELKTEAQQQQAKASGKVRFDVKNLPRGRYVLRVSKEQEAYGKKIETQRIVLE